jgi:hypothetical protein
LDQIQGGIKLLSASGPPPSRKRPPQVKSKQQEIKNSQEKIIGFDASLKKVLQQRQNASTCGSPNEWSSGSSSDEN